MSWGRQVEGRWQDALTLLDAMRRRGPTPNVVTYNSTISACGKGQQWQQALGLLKDARRAKLRCLGRIETALSSALKR